MFARIIAGQLRHEWVINLLLFLTMTALVSLYVFMQKPVGKPGKINAILSFECLHVGGSLESIHRYQRETVGLAMLAAVVGFLLGGNASVLLTTPFLATQTRDVTILWGNLPPTMALIAVVALIAEFIPMIKLVRMDPCAIVMEE